MMDRFGTNPAEQADGLLRFAAEWEPHAPAPDDFTDRVLQRLELEKAGWRQQRRRLNRAAGFLTLFLAAGAVCALLSDNKLSRRLARNASQFMERYNRTALRAIARAFS